MQIHMWLETEKEKELTRGNGYVISLPISQNRTLDESLDIGNFQMRTYDKESIIPFTKCKLIEDDGTNRYYFANSTPRCLNLNNQKWIHDVSLIEPTKILERHILGARSFSSSSSYFTTIKELINLILETCYPTRKGEVNPLYDSESPDYIYFDDKGRDEFNNIAKEYFFPEGTTLMDAFQAIGNSINAFPRMTDFHTLTFDFYNSTKQADISTLKKFDESATYNLDQYCGSIQSVVSNAIDKTTSTYYPDKINGTTLRSESIRISADTCLLKTDKPIYKINNIILKSNNALVNISGNHAGDSNFTTVNLKENLDLSKYVYEEREFRLLKDDETKSEGKYCALCYKTGDNLITNFNSYNKYFFGWFASNTSFENIIKIEIESDLGKYLGNDYIDSNVQVMPVFENYKNWEFIVEYIPIEKLSIKMYRNDISKNNALIYNNSSNIVDISYYGENLKAIIEKLGNEEYTMSFRTYSNSLPNPGEKIGNYYISSVNSEYYKYYTKVKLELVKEFNKICEDVGIDSQMRLYAIPDDGYVTERIIHLDYNVNDLQNDAEFNSNLSEIMNKISNNEGFDNKFFNNYYVYLQMTQAFAKPLSVYKVGKDLLFSFGFDDNSIGGYWNDNGQSKGELYCLPITGNASSITFKIKKGGNLNANEYPYLNINTLDNGVLKATIANLKKDAREIIKICYQIHLN